MTLVLPHRSAGHSLAPALVVAVALTMTSATGVGLFALTATTTAQEKEKDKEKAKPKLSLRASPVVSFSPTRIYLIAELKGGANDFEDFYCASVEWDWGDGTTSESGYDCDPYEAGKSEIRRRFPVEHVYKLAGTYVIEFKLKHKDKVLGVTRATVQVRPGVYGGG